MANKGLIDQDYADVGIVGLNRPETTTYASGGGGTPPATPVISKISGVSAYSNVLGVAASSISKVNGVSRT